MVGSAQMDGWCRTACRLEMRRNGWEMPETQARPARVHAFEGQRACPGGQTRQIALEPGPLMRSSGGVPFWATAKAFAFNSLSLRTLPLPSPQSALRFTLLHLLLRASPYTLSHPVSRSRPPVGVTDSSSQSRRAFETPPLTLLRTPAARLAHLHYHAHSASDCENRPFPPLSRPRGPHRRPLRSRLRHLFIPTRNTAQRNGGPVAQ